MPASAAALPYAVVGTLVLCPADDPVSLLIEVCAVYARVFRARFAVSDIDAAIQKVLDVNVPAQAGEPGSRGGLMMVNRATGAAMAVGLYDTEDDVNASAEAFRARSTAPGIDAGSAEVEVYEVFSSTVT